MRGAEILKSGICQSARAAGRLVKLAVLCAVAIFAAVALSVLFSGAVVSDNLEGSDLEKGDFVLAWKPAYVFSVPQEGELVLCALQGDLSAENGLSAAVYDEDEIDMSSVRGKIIVRIPEKFALGE